MRIHLTKGGVKLLALMLLLIIFSQSNTAFAHEPTTTPTPPPRLVFPANDTPWKIYLPILLKQGNSDDDEIASDALAHFNEDFVVMDPATEARLAAMARPGYGLRPANAEVTTASADLVGQWSAVQDWPVVAVHMTLLPNGKVLAFDSIGDFASSTYPVHDTTRAMTWDYVTNEIIRVDVDTGYNIFCSGHAHLPDGRTFIAGGTLNSNLDGITKTHIFNHQNNDWSLGPNMTQGGRWYPTVTPLANGETLIIDGRPDTPEVYNMISDSLRTLNGATLSLHLYPWMQVAPDGRVFNAGPEKTMRFLDTTGGGFWQTVGNRDSITRNYGSHAMYDIGKILVSGGGASSPSAVVIDLNNGAQSTPTGSMTYGRRVHQLTILADGTVVATGGNSSGETVDMSNGVYAAELWNPATGQWTVLASMLVTRQYHSTALLLPDGRVLSAGGGVCGKCTTVGYINKNAEIFSPPYLFKKDGSNQLAPRPTISAAPNTLDYQQLFTVNSPQAATIQKISLVRLSSVTHSVNMEQRFIPLSFSSGSGQLTVTAPANANIAPPGYYMLFIIDNEGVPSLAKMIQLQVAAPPPPTNTFTLAPTDDAYVRSGSYAANNFGTATILATRTDTGTSVNRRSYFKFDTASVIGPVSSVKLRVYGQNSTTGSLTVETFAVSDTAWTESSLTWNNKPGLGSTALAGQTIASTTKAWYEFDVTPYVQSERAAGRTIISLALKVPTNNSLMFNNNSKENTKSNGPQLVIVQ